MESIVFGIALTVSLMVREPTPTGREAARYASIATYKHSGLDKIIEPKLESLEKEYIPENIRKLGLSINFINRLTVDKRIEYSWSF